MSGRYARMGNDVRGSDVVVDVLLCFTVGVFRNGCYEIQAGCGVNARSLRCAK